VVYTADFRILYFIEEAYSEKNPVNMPYDPPTDITDFR